MLWGMQRVKGRHRPFVQDETVADASCKHSPTH
jgi:hypothetical protein